MIRLTMYRSSKPLELDPDSFVADKALDYALVKV